MERYIDVDELLESKRLEVKIAEIKIDKHFVKHFRTNNHLTQATLANILGVTKKTIEKWEQGINSINGSSAVLLKLLNDNPSLLSQLYSVKVVKGKQEADVAPVLHAHWVNHYDYGSDYESFNNGYTCSNCKYIWWETIYLSPSHFRYVHMPKGSYCPNCGAKMDEVAEDGEIEKAKVENDG